jgi:hypothetical protein
MPKSNRSRYIKSGRPETIRQAKRWDVAANKAERLGLCRKCAGQHAWGLQIGFGLSHPPCPTCAAVVDAIGGEERPNGWRVLPTKAPAPGTRNRPGGPETPIWDPLTGIDGYARCRRCGDCWTGCLACHCSADGCHVTFINAEAFDTHRRYDKRRKRRVCLDPETAGLIKIHRTHFVGWGFPPDRPGPIN